MNKQAASVEQVTPSDLQWIVTCLRDKMRTTEEVRVSTCYVKVGRLNPMIRKPDGMVANYATLDLMFTQQIQALERILIRLQALNENGEELLIRSIEQ